MAVIFFNCAVMFAVVNVLAWPVETWLRHRDEIMVEIPVRTRYPDVSLPTAYPGFTDSEIDNILRETWSRTHEYEPFTQHRERAFTGKYVNVDAHGFRRSQHEPWPPSEHDPTVFLFGGSTTFGWGLPDDQTIGYYLAEELKRRLGHPIVIYNFGRGYYYSSQERALFAELLAKGHTPDLAIFVDGLNDFVLTRPAYTRQLSRTMNGERNSVGLAERLPALQLVKRAIKNSPETGVTSGIEVLDKPLDSSELEKIDYILNRYEHNRKLIEGMAAKYDVEVIFSWQPVPVFKYNLENHPFKTGGGAWMRQCGAITRAGYARLEQSLEGDSGNRNMLWLADMQLNLNEPLYVDQHHYTAKMSARIASAIADRIESKGVFHNRPEAGAGLNRPLFQINGARLD